ncbi:MAG: hypothetical protein OJF59_001141 [Cytophagales bacterium]|jgi:hypothetical protein|nr:hypothetical protein [Bacteroidota bacterium]MBS1979866.1 hypothetical protein [Bacteroidota bacterium]WHZ07388.1 MAG: hypothetical protein OJF59_001141 [Cytophagales bacterium]
MKVPAQNFKGIEYVQISSLPKEQEKLIWKSISYKSIIIILKEKELINDCLQYQHYLFWYENVYKAKVGELKNQDLVAA